MKRLRIILPIFVIILLFTGCSKNLSADPKNAPEHQNNNSSQKVIRVYGDEEDLKIAKDIAKKIGAKVNEESTLPQIKEDKGEIFMGDIFKSDHPEAIVYREDGPVLVCMEDSKLITGDPNRATVGALKNFSEKDFFDAFILKNYDEIEDAKIDLKKSKIDGYITSESLAQKDFQKMEGIKIIPITDYANKEKYQKVIICFDEKLRPEIENYLKGE